MRWESKILLFASFVRSLEHEKCRSCRGEGSNESAGAVGHVPELCMDKSVCCRNSAIPGQYGPGIQGTRSAEIHCSPGAEIYCPSEPVAESRPRIEKADRGSSYTG